jgi:hypothetical protein
MICVTGLAPLLQYELPALVRADDDAWPGQYL